MFFQTFVKSCCLGIYLNLILFFLFVLKSLIFRPQFVEYRQQTISVDKNPISYGQNEDSEASHSWTNTIKQFFQGKRNDREFFVSSSDKLKLEEKQCSGSLGTFYKLSEESTLVQKSKIELTAKLINLNRLQNIIEDINGISPSMAFYSMAQPTEIDKVNRLNEDMQTRYKKFIENCFEISESNKDRVIHPNIVYIKHIFVHYQNSVIPQNNMELRKVLKEIQDLDYLRNAPQLASLILLVLPSVKLNLRLLMLNNWSHFTLMTAVEFGKQIARGMDYLQEQLNMPHLNLKPENIIAVETDNVHASNIHDKYVLKLTDIGCASLLPTTHSVLSTSPKSTIYRLSPLFSNFLNGSPEEMIYYDVHCYSLILLLMMIGYEQFSNCFMLSTFPAGLIASPKLKLINLIADQDKRLIPQPFCDLFQMMLADDKLPKSIFKNIYEHVAFATLK